MGTYSAESERLCLEPLAEGHLENYHAIQSNQSSMMWSESPPFTSHQQTLDYIRQHQAKTAGEARKKIPYAIILKDSIATKPKMIGTVTLMSGNEIGYKLHPEYWGKGYASEVLKLFLDMFWKAEENQKHEEIFADADSDNVASTRVLEKAGFRKSGGLLKDYYLRASSKGVRSDMQRFFLRRPAIELQS